MTNIALAVAIPDSQISREATQLIRDTESETLYQHSLRVYYWAAITGIKQQQDFDPELLYISALFHDVGLTSKFSQSQVRFEVDGANAAREFLTSRNIATPEIDKVWLAIALHTTPGIPEHLNAESALLQAGAGMDVAGRGFDNFTADERLTVVTRAPRERDFALRMIDEFYEGLRHRPASTFGTFNDDFLAEKDKNFVRTNICSVMFTSSWEKCAHHNDCASGHSHKQA